MTVIRTAKETDAERLWEIYDYYVQNTAISFEIRSPAIHEFAARMEKTLSRYPFLVAERNGRIEGYAYAGPLKDREAYDFSCEVTIYVDHPFRKSGLGKLLYERLEAELGKMGILNLYACIAFPEAEDEYLTANSAGFHAHMGYRKVGEFHRCGYKFGRWYSMIWMEKMIGDHVKDPPPVFRAFTDASLPESFSPSGLSSGCSS